MDDSDIRLTGRPPDPRAAFAELSKIMLGAQPLSETLSRIAELAKQTVRGAAEVSVTLMQDGTVSSVSFTGPLAAQLDERQYEAGFGPCMDAALSGATIPSTTPPTAAPTPTSAGSASGTASRTPCPSGFPSSGAPSAH